MRVLQGQENLPSLRIVDVSTEFRPEHKPKEAFRDYSTASPRHEIVRKTYHNMHTQQAVDFVKKCHKTWLNFDHAEMTTMEALYELNKVIDDSDPDVDVPNIYHAFQTAERIRQLHPDKDWFALVGLIHDLGKIMALFGEPQWAVVGDTFPVGCAPHHSVVFCEQFAENPDMQKTEYNTQLGMYKENCGLENVTMSWGHDEYMYRVLKHNNSTLPEEGMYMIRYHSFYPWHTGKGYDYLCSDRDREMLSWVLEFNKFDLYSKSDELPDIEKLKPYYQSLIDKYMPGVLKW